MKIYTEEQVKQMIQKSRDTGLNAEYLILTTESIQLPTDEEIEKQFTVGIDVKTEYSHKIEGAQWMRDKIKGGEK